MSNRAISVYSAALDQQAKDKPSPETTEARVTPQPTSVRDNVRDTSREKPRGRARDNVRGKSRTYPTRDEVQEFSFSLRDELKVKVQAEVPHTWQKELDEIARKMDVKKLELYRYILGEFLGKVKDDGD